MIPVPADKGQRKAASQLQVNHARAEREGGIYLSLWPCDVCGYIWEGAIRGYAVLMGCRWPSLSLSLPPSLYSITHPHNPHAPLLGFAIARHGTRQPVYSRRTAAPSTPGAALDPSEGRTDRQEERRKRGEGGRKEREEGAVRCGLGSSQTLLTTNSESSLLPQPPRVREFCRHFLSLSASPLSASSFMYFCSADILNFGYLKRGLGEQQGEGERGALT